MSISQQGNRHQYDVMVIGGGIAGISFILSLLELQPEAKIALICKSKLTESNSWYAQGGIAAVQSEQDSLEQHVLQDTLTAGDGLCHQTTVENILKQSNKAIEFLEKHQVRFDHDEQQNPLMANEGGHSHRRIFHHGDETGKAIMRALVQQVLDHPQVTIFEKHIAVNLITQFEWHQPQQQKSIVGAYILDETLGLIHTFLAKSTVLATGGAGKVFRYTSNPDIATGDGIAMAFRAGSRVGNMEFYQFHPTALYHPTETNFLISEAVRGEGGVLRLADSKEAFMEKYDAENLELSTRDVVARAIFTEIERSSHNHVYLDIRHLESEYLQNRFPNIFQKLKSLGIDMSKDMIPVIPAAHYLCGGVMTDAAGNTDLKRLFAIGETAFTGLHGANRLASNSLLEAVVMGQLAAKSCQDLLAEPINYSDTIKAWDSNSVHDLRRASQINAHWRGLRSEMMSYAGIVRTDAGLKDLLQLIQLRSEMIEEYYWNYTITRDLIELRNILLVARLIVRSAMSRRESRGGHYRADYPMKDFESEASLLNFNDLFNISL